MICGTQWTGFFGRRSFLSGICISGTAIFADKEQVMKRIKDFNACLSSLRERRDRNGIRPEQLQNLEAAIDLLKKLRRLKNPTQPEMFKLVRQITDSLLKAFLK
jgi:hypothetical protein